ncbi:Galactoside 2-alpha-L-fucosyltransferase [Bertholletia excelsa]
MNNPSTNSDMHKDKLFGGLLAATFNEGSCLSRHQPILYRKPSLHKASSHLISRLRRYEALHKRCGPWNEFYNTSLNQLKSGHSSAVADCKYLVHLWMPHSGLGNRMLSLASSFLYALLTNRVLLIELGEDMAGLFCEPFPDTTWALPQDFPMREQFRSSYQNSPHCYGNMLRNKEVDSSMNKSLPPFMYLHLLYDYDNYDKLFFCDEDQNFMKKISWLALRSDQYFIPSLFLIPSFEKELSNFFPEREAVFHHLSRYLFHPSNHVWGLVTRYYEAYLAKSDERIGIQIRDYSSTALPFQSMKDHIASYYLPHLATDETTVNQKRGISLDLSSPFSFMMDRVVACSLENNLLPRVIDPKKCTSSPPKNSKRKAILVTSLNSWYFENISGMYWEHQTITGEVIGVFQPSHEEFQQNMNPMHNMKALAEIYLLSLVDELVTSPWSTFGYVAQSLGGLRPWILNNPHKQMASDPPCYQAMSMEPCFHFPPSYDCKAKTRVDTGAKVPYVRHCEDTIWGIKLFDDYD